MDNDYFGRGPKDHGFPAGTRVRALRLASGAATGLGTVIEDRDTTVPVNESRYVYPIAVRDDNGLTYFYRPIDLVIIDD